MNARYLSRCNKNKESGIQISGQKKAIANTAIVTLGSSYSRSPRLLLGAVCLFFSLFAFPFLFGDPCLFVMAFPYCPSHISSEEIPSKSIFSLRALPHSMLSPPPCEDPLSLHIEPTTELGAHKSTTVPLTFL